MAEDTTYEKLGVFYLGRPYDLERGETVPTPLLYDSRDLVTHGMIVGMTGSGKTGLLLSLLEEAAQQAETWRQGLAKWGQGPDRIARLREAADFAIYTPGSEAGLPISIL